MRLPSSLALALTASASLAQMPPPSQAPIPAGGYTLDQPHSSLVFRVNHLGFSMFTLRFSRFDAKLAFDPAKPESSNVQVTIDPRSISTDSPPEGFLDSLGSGAEWLDARRFPEMKFVSRRVEVVSPGDYRVHGELTIHGVTKPVTLATRFNGGYAGHPFDPAARVGFSAKGAFKRSDFGIVAGLPAPGSIFGVGDELQVSIEAEFTGAPLAGAKK
jgi:polyisoprenoid-binding protein YceI